MILTKKAFIKGLNKPLDERLRQYKRFRKPKYSKPFSVYISFVGCYGDLFYS